jgi:hypothetical protein
VLIFIAGSQLYSIEKPYYFQPASLIAQTEYISEGPLRGLKVAPETAAYARKIILFRNSPYFETGSPIFMPGYGTALIFLLDGYSPRLIHLFGGWSNSINVASFVHETISQEEYNSMLIISTEPSLGPLGRYYLPHVVAPSQNELVFSLVDPVLRVMQQFWRPNKEHYPERNRITIGVSGSGQALP